MIRRTLLAAACAAGVALALGASSASAQEAYGRQWGYSYNTQDWSRFYHYPYVYYPQNFWGPEYYRSAQSLYFRYPQEMRIPVYNRGWHSEYPQFQRYYQGSHFMLDTF